MSKCNCSCLCALDAYELLKEMPDLPAGTVFVHDKEDSKLGSPANGCLKLAWFEGNCQWNHWCGHTFILPGQMTENSEWFRKVKNRGQYT